MTQTISNMALSIGRLFQKMVGRAASLEGSAQGREPLSEEAVKRIQTRLLAIQSAAASVADGYLEEAKRFVEEHRRFSDWGVMASFDEPAGMLYTRVQRTLAELSRALRRSLPVALRRAGTGVLHMEWSIKDGNPITIARWEGSNSAGDDVLAMARESATQLGEFSDEAGGALVRALLKSLQMGKAILPEFVLTRSTATNSEWLWTRQDLVPQAMDETAAKAELERLLKEAIEEEKEVESSATARS